MKVSVRTPNAGGTHWSESSVNLTKSNFLASGGEGDVYVKSGMAYKIYHDASKMIPEGKFKDLANIQHPDVIAPQGLVFNSKNNKIGYSMRYVTDTYTLCQVFTKAFRNRNNLSHDQMQGLVKRLHNIVQSIHSKNVLIVDLNEMNFLVSNDFKDVYAIDTDSYQTRSYPATAIMESIRDRHSKTFSENTDWFSYGVVSFQMFTGIHPYKGKHPTIKGMDERMKANISVFHPDVSVPKACYPLDVIPESYKQWYKAVFDDGKRVPPPLDFGAVQVVVRVDVVKGSDNVIVDLIHEYEGDIISAASYGGTKVLTDKYFYVSNKKKHRVFGSVPFKTQSGTSLLARLDLRDTWAQGDLKLFNADTSKEIPVTITGQNLMAYDGTLYIKSGDRVLQLETVEMGQNIIVSTKVAATVLENSSKFFDGVLVQNLLGSFYVSVFPEPGKHYQIQMKELDGHKIVDAKYDSGVLMVVTADRTGKYDRLVFRFDEKFSSYDMRAVEDISPVGVNFVVLDNGVSVCINEEDELEIFSRRKDSQGLKIVQDKTISADMKLFKSGATLMFAKSNKLYTAKMK